MLKRYIGLLMLFIKNSLIQALAYRVDFVVSLLTDACYCLVRVLFVGFMFQHVAAVGNWSFEHFMVYFGCAFLMEGFYMFFFFNGHTRISLKIMSGEMDYFLSKPISEIFYMSFHSSNIGSGISNLVLGICYFTYGIRNLQLSVSPERAGMFIVLMGLGLIIYFSLSFMINCLSFWILQAGTIFNLFMNLTDLQHYPGEIFPKEVNFFVTFLIPFQFISMIPAKLLLGEVGMGYVIAAVSFAMIALALVKILYHFARKAYSSGRG